MFCFQDYIMDAPINAQNHLLSIIQFISNEFPDSKQRIYHHIPTFFLGTKDIINIGAYKDHIGLHIDYAIIDCLKEKYPNQKYTKSTIQLPYTEQLPIDLLQEICVRIKEQYNYTG